MTVCAPSQGIDLTNAVQTSTPINGKEPKLLLFRERLQHQSSAKKKRRHQNRQTNNIKTRTERMGLECNNFSSKWDAVAVGLVVWLLFAVVYGVMHQMDDRHFGFVNPIVDPLYFSSTTTTTVGYGDLTPKSVPARAVVIVHQLGVMGVFVLLVCTLFNKNRKKYLDP